MLGLAAGASVEEIRAARRRLAKEHHPDAGGDAARMRALNQAAAEALRTHREQPVVDGGRDDARANGQDDAATGARGRSARSEDDRIDVRGAGGFDPHRLVHDTPSFTIEALPAEAFEALLIAASVLGEVLDDDPPYRLEAVLGGPLHCWCRLDVVPDAGSSSVDVTVGALDGRPRPPLEVVRDVWIDELNRLDWPADDDG